MKEIGRPCIAVIAIALWWSSGSIVEALKMDHNTVFGGLRVDRDGLQIGHRMVMFQWQDGKKVIVWPEELAPSTPRFPTPPWSQRR